MSGFPGPHSYSEHLASQIRHDREEARSEAEWPVVERTPDADDIYDAALLRARLIQHHDSKSSDMLKRLVEYSRVQRDAIRKLEEMCRSTHGPRAQ